jgi:ADP-ribose pyrophosphatase
VRFEPPDDGPARPFYVIEAPHWINVIPLTAEGSVLMVRQFRFGIEDLTLEIPGGMCDGDEAPIVAARRELREETGYDSDDLIELGWVHPNPPVQNNRCYTYLARNPYRVGDPEPDRDERFEQVRVALDDVPRLIADRTITHALVLAAFHLLEGSRGDRSTD